MFAKLSDNSKMGLCLCTAGVLYLPLIFMGLGTDGDIPAVYQSATKLFAEHAYTPSRYPGFFVHEFFTGLLLTLLGPVGSNFGTMAMSLLMIYSFIRLCEHYQLGHKYLLAVMLMGQPYYWVASTSSIDFVWALSFFFVGLHLHVKGKLGWAVLFMGLAIGCRLSTVFLVGACFLSRVLFKTLSIRQFLVYGILTGLLGAMCYIPSFIHAQYSLTFITYYVGDWSRYEYVIRFLYKNVYFWGLGAFVMVPLLIYLFGKNRKGLIENREILLMGGLVFVCIEALFLKLPTKIVYLLPIFPFFLFAIGALLKEQHKVVVLFLLLVISYNVVTINTISVDRPHYATAGRFDLRLDKGHLVKDIQLRRQYYFGYSPTN